MRIEALVVGINEHVFEPRFNLEAPVKDAEAIAEMLEKYGKFHVQGLPKDYDETGRERFISDGFVNRKDLEERISNLFSPISKKEIPDVALFFFAGHGHVTTKGGIREGFLVTSDVQPKRDIYGISLNWFKDLLRQSPVKKQIVWLDCCFSGELLNFQEADPGTGKEISRCFITASRSFEESVSQIDRKNGVFTAKLLEGLNPENSIDGWVTNYILADSIRKNMLNISQSPVFHNSGDAIILTTNTPTKSLDGRWKKTPPYRALSYFTEQEKDGVFFHGRTRLTDELIDRVRTNNFVVVWGASGSGKSSLLRAGLLYQLKRGQKISGSDRWSYIKPFTPSYSPLESLQKAVNIEGEKTENLTEKLIDFINQAEAEKVLMVIDQFEESFTLCKNDEKRREFFDCFLSVLANEKTKNKFCLVLGMRADFLDQCSKYSGLATEIKEHQLLVTPLEKDEIEEAIKKPAELVGMAVEAKLVAQMAEDFLRNPGSLPLLQYTLNALWKSATQGENKSPYLTLASYEKLGGIQGTLTKQADAVYEGLNKEKKSVAKRIFLELVQPGERSVNFLKVTDTRRRVILEKLPNKQHSLELLLEVSDNLADPNNRLITKDNSEAGTLLDIIHEDLIRSWKTLRGWVEEYQEALPVERKIEADAAGWEKDGKNEGLLLRETQLTKAEDYVTKYGDMGLLDGLAYEFIEASQELRIREEKEEKERRERELEQEKKARKLAQRQNQILGVSLVLMTGVSGYAWMQQNIAKHNSEIFFTRQLAAKAELLTTYNSYDTTVLLGVQSMNRIQEFKEWRDSGWRKVVRKFLGSQFSVVPQNAADGAIRKGLTQLPDHFHTLTHHDDVNAVAFSPDGKTIATAYNKIARLWDTENGKELATLNHQDSVIAVAFSPDGKTIATASDDNTARLWDTETGKELAILNHQKTVKAVAFSPDGKTIATASDDDTACLWDTDTRKELAILNHQDIVKAVAFSPDGKTIATGSYDNTARLWDTDTGKELAILNHQGTVKAVAFSPDGKTIATASNDKTARLCDTDTGKELAILNYQKPVDTVAFSPDGKSIATASSDDTARLWDTDTGIELATLNHQGDVKAVAFSPDGKTIATASDDKTVRLWDTDTGKELATLNHQRSVKAVAFSPDGKTIATASSDDTARLWDTDTGIELATLNHQETVNAVAFSPDGKTIATASWDNTARLWDTDTGIELATLNHQDTVEAVAFSPDGKTIATASWDNTARLHWTTSEGLIQEACSRLSRNLTAKEWQQYINSDLETYQKTCKNLPADPRLIALAPGKIIEGRKLAKDGKIGEAIYLFKKAQELSPEIDLEPDAETRETDPQIVANKLAASGKVEEGKKLAKQGKIEEAIALFKNAQELSPEIDLTFVASDIVEEGKKLAKQGKIEEAIALFKKAQELSPEIDLAPDTETKETDPQLVANKLAALSKVEEGKKLAKQGKIEEAIALFKNAQELSPEIDLTPDAETRETDPQLVANKLAALSKVEEGKKLAKQGKIEEAIALFKNAQELSPEIDLTFVASDIVEEGKKLAKQGKIEEAIALFKKAQELSPEIDLAPDTETKETDPQFVANKLAALSKVEEGKKLAKQGKIEEAIALFKKAQELSPEIDLTPDAETRETDLQLVANKFVVSVIVEESKNLARQGKIEEAIYLFKKFQELSSEIDLDKEQQRQIEEQIVKLLGMLSDSIIRLKPSLFDTGVLLGIESMKQYFDIKKRYGKANSDLLVELDQTLRNGLTQLPKYLHALNHQGRVNAVAFRPDSKTIATASYDKTARLWDTDTGKELAILNHQDSVNAVAFSPDGKTMATRSNTTASLWETENGKELATLNHHGWVNAVAFSPDGKTIATASYDKTARLWDTNTGNELAILNHQEWVRAVAFSPDAKTIATASDDNTARLWDTNTGNELATLNHQGDVRAVVFSPDSKTIATASYDKTARLWDTDTGKELAILNHQGDVRAVVFSPDSKTIATASWDNTARLWDTDTGKELAILNHEYRLIAVAFSPDGKTIATASDDKTSRLWDTRNGKQLAILNHQDRVSAVAFSPDGKTIATASNDKTSRLWDTDPGKELATLNHQDIVKAVAFSPDGQTAATANDDTTACLHWETVEVLIQESCERLSRNLTAEEWQKYINNDLEKYQKTCENIPVHPSIIAEAKNLVKKGTKEKLKKAIDISKKALELSPEIDITFVASDIVEEGKKLAKQGKIEEAIYLFKKAQELSTEIDLAPDTENRETDPQIVANKLAASSKVEEGQKLAKQGKIEEAIVLFKKAQKLSPEIDLAPDTETKETDPQIVANKLAAPGKVEEGQKLAKDGKIEEAIALFKKAQELSPEIDLTFVASDIVEEGKKLAKQGKIEEAIVLFKKAQELSPEIDLEPNTENRETDPQLVANKLAASGKVEEGKNLARQGKIEEAIALFKNAQELSPERTIDLNFVVSDIAEEGRKLAKQGKRGEAIALFKNAQLVKNKLAAPSKVEEGKNLARQGKIEEAIALFKNIQELLPEIDLTFVVLEIVEEGKKLAKQGKREEAIALFKNAQLVVNKFVAPRKVEAGKNLARQGKIEEAIYLFKDAQESSPEIDLNFVASDIVEEGKKLAKQGKIEEAIALFKNAQELSPEIDLEPDTETRETDPQIVANKFAALGKEIEDKKAALDKIIEGRKLAKDGKIEEAIYLFKNAEKLSLEINLAFVASDIVKEGQKLAKQGKIEEAITLFKNAQELSPEIDLAPDTETKETDPQLVANKLAAPSKVEEGKKLAKQGKIEEAIALFENAQELLPEIDITFVASDIVEEGKKLAKQGKIEEAIYLFKKAQELSPEVDLDPETETKETDPQLVANKLAASGKVEEGKKLAKQGQIEEAIYLFKKAQELSPEIDLAPDTKTRETDPQLVAEIVAKKYVVSVIVEESINLAKQGQIEEAIYLFKKAQKLSPEIPLDPDFVDAIKYRPKKPTVKHWIEILKNRN